MPLNSVPSYTYGETHVEDTPELNQMKDGPKQAGATGGELMKTSEDNEIHGLRGLSLVTTRLAIDGSSTSLPAPWMMRPRPS